MLSLSQIVIRRSILDRLIMTKLTFIIPVGPGHFDVYDQAVASVQAQTIPCEHIVVRDETGMGAGYARNRGLEHVESEYVSFLDADDVLDPRFAEITLGVLDEYAAQKSDERYVYTDWLGIHNEAHKAPEPCEAWTNKTFHLVTAVIPTHRVRLVGGFDEVLQGVEDADFYVRLRLSGLCGLHVNAPLVNYREGGQRSVQARLSGEETRALQYMSNRYGGFNLMGCCGSNEQNPIGPENEPSDGDVLAQALWNGNARKLGLASGRLYPRTSYPKLMYVNPKDVDAAPHQWQRVASPMQAANGVILQPEYKSSPDTPWQLAADAIFGGGQSAPQPQSPIEYKPHAAPRKKADVIAKAQEWTKIEGSDLK
jgi:hypothetical protein